MRSEMENHDFELDDFVLEFLMQFLVQLVNDERFMGFFSFIILTSIEIISHQWTNGGSASCNDFSQLRCYGPWSSETIFAPSTRNGTNIPRIMNQFDSAVITSIVNWKMLNMARETLGKRHLWHVRALKCRTYYSMLIAFCSIHPSIPIQTS